MYKGLKPELTDIVDKIDIGHGVIVKHKHDYIKKRSIGYVYNKTKKGLELRPRKNPTFFFEIIDNVLSSIGVSYKSIDDIKIIDQE